MASVKECTDIAMQEAVNSVKCTEKYTEHGEVQSHSRPLQLHYDHFSGL